MPHQEQTTEQREESDERQKLARDHCTNQTMANPAQHLTKSIRNPCRIQPEHIRQLGTPEYRLMRNRHHKTQQDDIRLGRERLYHKHTNTGGAGTQNKKEKIPAMVYRILYREIYQICFEDALYHKITTTQKQKERTIQ